MEEKENPQNVYQMISAVTAKLVKRGGVAKDQENDYDKYKFRGIDDVYDALAPIISDVGLVILPTVTSRENAIRQGTKGTSLSYVTVTVDYRLVSSQDRTEVTVTFVGEAMDRSDKATNKALSAAYKYMCFEVFCIPLEGDGDEESPELGKQQNSTGNQRRTAAQTAADEVRMDPNLFNEALSGIQAACFNDDPAGFFEIYDELNGDERVKVYGSLDAPERKQCKAWINDRPMGNAHP